VQQVVQLVRIAQIGPSFSPHLLDGRGIQFAYLFQHRFGKHAPHLDRPGSAFLERRIIEIGIGIGIEDLVLELRRYRGIDRH
jgi:hypothetical protein